MAKNEKVVVNEPKTSETPVVLVAPAKESNELSPNPAGSGFVKQAFVDSLPISGAANTIYLVPRLVNGGIVGYTKWKWDVATSKYERVLGNDPLLKQLEGGQGTLAHENNPEKITFEKIFNGDVAFQKEPYVQGKKLSDFIDSHGGVTEEELQAAIQGVKSEIPTESGITDIANTAIAEGIPYSTTAPTAANTNGKLKVVVLSEEPATKYDGYLYFIEE